MCAKFQIKTPNISSKKCPLFLLEHLDVYSKELGKLKKGSLGGKRVPHLGWQGTSGRLASMLCMRCVWCINNNMHHQQGTIDRSSHPVPPYGSDDRSTAVVGGGGAFRWVAVVAFGGGFRWWFPVVVSGGEFSGGGYRRRIFRRRFPAANYPADGFRRRIFRQRFPTTNFPAMVSDDEFFDRNVLMMDFLRWFSKLDFPTTITNLRNLRPEIKYIEDIRSRIPDTVLFDDGIQRWNFSSMVTYGGVFRRRSLSTV